MKFTVLSHAGLLVESEGGSLLFDPWLVGSCYWRSWWNFPEPPEELVRSLRPSALYLTHLHWDHFHGPSLRRFPRETPVFVPRMPGRRMLEDLAACGFRNVVEIPHGGSVEAVPGLELHSFQFGAFFTDSAAVVTDGWTTLLNANDCKLFGLPLRQVTKRFPRIDFCFRSHSSAGPLPHCVDGWRERFPEHRPQDAHAREFARFALEVGARHAVPFASNHCFLHPETLRFNELATSPGAVAEVFRGIARAAGSPSRCVVMPPGSSWSDDEGFRLLPWDESARDAEIERLRVRAIPQVLRQERIEERTAASFDAFDRSFRAFLRALPWLLPRRLRPRVLFEAVEAARSRWFLVDCRSGDVAELPARSAAGVVDVEIRVAALILNDCTRKRMFSAWTPGKRLRIRVNGPSLRPVSAFLALLDLHESDMLPLRRNLTLRALGVRLRRWREPVELARLLLSRVVLRRPVDVAELYRIPAQRGRAAGSLRTSGGTAAR